MNMNLSLIDHKGIVKKLHMKPLLQKFNLNTSFGMKHTRTKSNVTTLTSLDKSSTNITIINKSDIVYNSPKDKGNKVHRYTDQTVKIINRLKKNNELNKIILKNDFRKSNNNNTSINKSYLDKSTINNSKQFNNTTYKNTLMNDSRAMSTLVKESVENSFNNISNNNITITYNNSILRSEKKEVDHSLFQNKSIQIRARTPTASKSPIHTRKGAQPMLNKTDIAGSAQPSTILHNDTDISKDDFTFRNSFCKGTRTIFEMKKADNPIMLKHNGLINTIKVKIRNESDLKTKQSFYKLIKLDPKATPPPKYAYSQKGSYNSEDQLNFSFNTENKMESRSTTVNESIRKSRDSPKILVRHPHLKDFFEK
jgi:hypothetical protein